MEIIRNKNLKRNKYTVKISYQDESGMRHREVKSFQNYQSAVEWGARREKDSSIATPNTLLVDYTRKFVSINVLPFITSQSARSYNQYLRHLEKRLPDVTLCQVSQRVVQGYLDSLHYAPKSVSKERDLLRKVFDEAVAEGLIKANPITAHTLVHGVLNRSKPRSTKFMPASEFTGIRTYLDDHAMERRNYFVLFIIANTALRVGEALALKRDDLNFEDNTIRVDETFDETSGQVVDPKTERSKRTIPVPAIVMDKIHKWFHVQKIELFKLGVRNDDEFLFLSAKGKLPRASSVNRSYQTLQRDLGYTTHYTTHTIRHTLASLMLEDPDIPLAYISRYLGHASESVTKKYYLGVIPDHVGKLEQDTLSVIKNL